MKKLYYNLNSSKHVNHPHDMKLVPRARTIGKVSENSTLRWSRDIIEPLLILSRHKFARFFHSHNQVYLALQSEHVSHLELLFHVA